MSFEGFDFTDFHVGTPFSTEYTDADTTQPQQLKEDIFIGGSLSDNEHEDKHNGGGDESSSCASVSHFRSRSHSIAFFGDFDVSRSLPTWEDLPSSVHLSHIFEPTAMFSAHQRRSSMCSFHQTSASNPPSPVKKRLSVSSTSSASVAIVDLPDIFDSPQKQVSSSDEGAFSSDFAPSNPLRRHSVAASSFEIYRCPFEGCGKVFSRRYNLDTHVRVHTGEKPFVCSSCQLSFARNHDLRRHERIHMPDREFSCEHCCKKFSRQDALRRHERSNSCYLVNNYNNNNPSFNAVDSTELFLKAGNISKQ